MKEAARKKTNNKIKKQNEKRHGWKLFCVVMLMLIWVGASIIVAQLVVAYAMAWILGPEKLAQPVWVSIYSALSYIVALLLIIFVPPLLAKKWKKTDEKMVPKFTDRIGLGLKGTPTWTDVGLAPAGFILYLLLATGLTTIFSFFPWFNIEEVQEVGFSTYIFGFDRIIAFITLVILAPIAEEIIFRGWLYDKLRTKLSSGMSNMASMILSILLVSVLFGIVHLQWNVGVNVFAMSVVLCGLREITGTIYSGILLHMLKNGIAFYCLYILGIS